MDEQRTVAAFVEEHDLEAPPAYRVLDLTSEVGELAKEVNESTAYGATPADVDAAVDELGDALFALLALANRSRSTPTTRSRQPSRSIAADSRRRGSRVLTSKFHFADSSDISRSETGRPCRV